MKNWLINFAVKIFVKRIINKGISDQDVFELGKKVGTIITKQGTKVGGKNFNIVENALQKKYPLFIKGLDVGLDLDD